MCVGLITPPSIMKALDEAILKNGVEEAFEEVEIEKYGPEKPVVPTIVRSAEGLVEPIPMRPSEVIVVVAVAPK